MAIHNSVIILDKLRLSIIALWITIAIADINNSIIDIHFNSTTDIPGVTVYRGIVAPISYCDTRI